MSGKARAGQTFLLVAGFVCGALAGAWLGLVAAFVSSISPSGPARFSGEDFAAALVATFSLAAVYVLVRQTDRQGRAAALGLLFVASFAALCALYVLRPLEVLCVVPWPSVEASVGASVRHAVYQEATPGCRPVPPVLRSPSFFAAMAPAMLVTVLLCSAAVRRSAVLRLAGLGAGGLFALAGLLLSLARTLS